MWRRPRVISLTVLAAVGFLIGSSSPAHACSCVRGSVSDVVTEADAVYVARPRSIDLFSGASFRVLRVLKGPARSNLRVKVAGGGGDTCGTSVSQVDYVIVSQPNGSPQPLNLCTEYLRGSTAVREAESVLGAGTPVPRRPDPGWLAQWALLVGGASLAILGSWRLASAMDKPRDPTAS